MKNEIIKDMKFSMLFMIIKRKQIKNCIFKNKF